MIINPPPCLLGGGTGVSVSSSSSTWFSFTLPRPFCAACAQVDKIFGPGNQYVTAAKMLLQNSEAMVAIDMPAGPSEVLVIADKEAPVSFVAADLLSQARPLNPPQEGGTPKTRNLSRETAMESESRSRSNGRYPARCLKRRGLLFLVHRNRSN